MNQLNLVNNLLELVKKCLFVTGDDKMIELLLDNGADPNVPSDLKETPLYRASLYGNLRH